MFTVRQTIVLLKAAAGDRLFALGTYKVFRMVTVTERGQYLIIQPNQQYTGGFITQHTANVIIIMYVLTLPWISWLHVAHVLLPAVFSILSAVKFSSVITTLFPLTAKFSITQSCTYNIHDIHTYTCTRTLTYTKQYGHYDNSNNSSRPTILIYNIRIHTHWSSRYVCVRMSVLIFVLF